jgi:hypothetical protein
VLGLAGYAIGASNQAAFDAAPRPLTVAGAERARSAERNAQVIWSLGALSLVSAAALWWSPR